MTRDFDGVGPMPFQAERLEAALSSIQDALTVLRVPSCKPPFPPARMTLADRLVEEPAAA
jgi:hypothetical protein